MLLSLFNKFIGPRACNFTKKKLQHKRFSVKIANFKNNYFKKHQRTAGSSSSYILHRKLNKILQEADWPSRLAFCLIWNIKSLYFTYSHSYSFVLWLVVICCHSLSFFLTRCYSLSFVVTCYTSRCDPLYHSLSFVVPLDTTLCTTTCHSLYHSLSFVITYYQTLRITISKNINGWLVLVVVIYCTENWIKFFRKRIGLPDWLFV